MANTAHDKRLPTGGTRDPDQDLPLFVGLSGLELETEEFDLGHRVRLRQTYAHLMAPFLMAFNRPAPGKHHPGPLKAAGGGFGFDILAELTLPPMPQFAPVPHLSIGRNIVALLRLTASPAIIAPVVSTTEFKNAAQTETLAEFSPLEVEPRRIPFQSAHGLLVAAQQLEWTKANWENALRLLAKNAEVRLALDALDRVQFLPSIALAMISVWGALESLFSPAKAELRFRVSANIAAYLEDSGTARLELQKRAAKLYDARSVAAHGGANTEADSLLQSYELLRRVLIKMFSENHVPDREELERRLFGLTE